MIDIWILNASSSFSWLLLYSLRNIGGGGGGVLVKPILDECFITHLVESMGLSEARDSSPGQKAKDDDKYEPTSAPSSCLHLRPGLSRSAGRAMHAVTVGFHNKV